MHSTAYMQRMMSGNAQYGLHAAHDVWPVDMTWAKPLRMHEAHGVRQAAALLSH
jgi:hypothetical protein